MMRDPLLVLLLGNFALIGSLPAFFFSRDGRRFNARWFLTGAPFFLVPVLLMLGRIGWLQPWLEELRAIQPASAVAAAVASSGSIVLIAAAMAAHRAAPALWHQENDLPGELVTRGPYARIRHPFYSSFLLAFLAAVAAFPHPGTLACLLYAAAALTLTARREERRLARSTFGEAYRRYRAASGRFLPRLRPPGPSS